MEKKQELKHKVLEVLEGGLRGNTAARIFSILLIVLIILSMVFMLIWDIDRLEPYLELFEIIETVTIGIFTLELILGFWTADVRFPDHRHPHVRYLTDFMTVVQFLAILPFYLSLILEYLPLGEISPYFQLLKLLHLLKIGQIGWHAAKETRVKRAEEKPEEETKEKSSEESDASLPSE